jgi:hypothetical protein
MDDEDFKALKAEYPKRARGRGYEWPKAFLQIKKRLAEGHSFDDIMRGTKDYCAASKISGDYGTEFIKMASTFYGPGLHFLDEYELEEPTPEIRYRRPQELTEEQRTADILKFEKDMKRLKG